MIISLTEIFYLIVMSLAIGYIFTGYIKAPGRFNHGFDYEDFKLALLVSAPAVVFHELGHKFVALFFGLEAIFNIFWSGLGFAIFLKLIASPFLIIAPGYVLVEGAANNFQHLLISFAGPFVNFVLFGVAWFFLNYSKNLTRNKTVFWHYTKQINLFLFIFNMLPIPPLDGFSVLSNLGRIIF